MNDKQRKAMFAKKKKDMAWKILNDKTITNKHRQLETLNNLKMSDVDDSWLNEKKR